MDIKCWSKLYILECGKPIADFRYKNFQNFRIPPVKISTHGTNFCGILVLRTRTYRFRVFPRPFTHGALMEGGLMRGDIDLMGGDLTLIDYIIN